MEMVRSDWSTSDALGAFIDAVGAAVWHARIDALSRAAGAGTRAGKALVQHTPSSSLSSACASPKPGRPVRPSNASQR
jgi:hypothetical protein